MRTNSTDKELLRSDVGEMDLANTPAPTIRNQPRVQLEAIEALEGRHVPGYYFIPRPDKRKKWYRVSRFGLTGLPQFCDRRSFEFSPSFGGAHETTLTLAVDQFNPTLPSFRPPFPKKCGNVSEP